MSTSDFSGVSPVAGAPVIIFADVTYKSQLEEEDSAHIERERRRSRSVAVVNA